MIRLVLAGLILAFATTTASAAVLENPFDGADASGVGVFAGWKCPPNDNISIVIDDGAPLPVPSRVARGDTAGACGNDGRNGFIAQFNFGLLGDGFHTAVVRQNGQAFATSTFHVTTFGVPFMTGASGVYVLENFPTFGKQTTIEWSQGAQNFVITDTTGGPITTPSPKPTATPKPTAAPTPGSSGGLKGMIGTWDFTYTIISTFTDRFYLPNDIRTANGVQVLVGEDEFGYPTLLTRVQDLVPGSPIPYEFGMVNYGILLCEAFFFDKTGTTNVAGFYTSAFYDGEDCGTLFGEYAMTGKRISTSAAHGNGAATTAVAATRALQRSEEAAGSNSPISAFGEAVQALDELR